MKSAHSNPVRHRLPDRTLRLVRAAGISALFLALLLNSCSRGVRYSRPDMGDLPATQRPYVINGITYYPLPSAHGYAEDGIASWYGPNFHGKRTSNGEIYDMHAMTAAHKTLPMNTMLLVRNLDNGRETIVRINDRGPFVRDRIVDLSFTAAQQLNIVANGTARIEAIALANRNQFQPTPIKAAAVEPPPPAPPVQAPRTQPTERPPAGLNQGQFYVQIAEFADRNHALRLQQRFAQAGFNSEIVAVEDPAKGKHRVQVYVGQDLDEARLAEGKLIELGYRDAFVVAH